MINLLDEESKVYCIDLLDRFYERVKPKNVS
jgi:hypothetical protein